ncbi:unnamed protein product [Moneuplotes crassus]|uniref:Dynein regulatory complex subunit 3 n=3 Tax=Euplotes crassus TaxID=5936 RepID=A0AAD1X6A3_EUPCR|nr:unnamed protein product [Moneuplotes crassus]
MEQAIVHDHNDTKEMQEAKKWEKARRGKITTQIKTRSKVQGKESVRPTVINSDLISEYYRDYNRENKIFNKDDTPLWEFTHLALSYRNIIDIDNLKGMEKLRKLQLDNNIIYKIQNLDHLINLEWLDLSFNQIEKIEGLGTLTKLTDLSLYNNHIEEVGGLGKLLELNVLSLGQNRIKSYENVITYLREIPNKLEVLTLEGNPCIKKENKEEYQLYAYAYLEKLQYLDYHIVKQEIRNAALEKHREDIDERDNQKEADKNVVTTPSLMSKERRAQLIEAHVLIANDIFKRNLAEDEVMQKFTILPNYQDIMQQIDDEVRDKIEEFINDILKSHQEKKDKIAYWTEILKEGETKAELKSIGLINEFKTRQNEQLKQINLKDPTDKELQEYKDWTHTNLAELEDKLMLVEMKLVESLGLANTEFSKDVENINNEMTTKITKFTDGVQDLINQFQTDLKDHAYKLNEEVTKEEDTPTYQDIGDDADLLQLIYDKDILAQFFEQCKENQENKMSEKNNVMRSDINNDWKNIKEKLTENQHDRNRNIILEIIDFCKDKKKDVEDLLEQYGFGMDE